MTFINRLIKECKADPPPREVTIRPNQVRALAAHAYGCNDLGLPAAKIEEHIRQGKLLLVGVPVRVLGANGETMKRCP